MRRIDLAMRAWRYFGRGLGAALGMLAANGDRFAWVTLVVMRHTLEEAEKAHDAAVRSNAKSTEAN